MILTLGRLCQSLWMRVLHARTIDERVKHLTTTAATKNTEDKRYQSNKQKQQ